VGAKHANVELYEGPGGVFWDGFEGRLLVPSTRARMLSNAETLDLLGGQQDLRFVRPIRPHDRLGGEVAGLPRQRLMQARTQRIPRFEGVRPRSIAGRI
jgi:hypothetical protein